VGASVDPAWRNDEVRALYDLALGYFEREITAHVAKWDEQRRIDREVWLKAGKLGLLLCSVPTEYGGGGGTFAHDIAVFDAQGYSGDLGLGIGVHSGIVPHYLLRYGSEEQKRSWLPVMASGEVLAGLAMTESGAGSDLKAIRTTAIRQGEDYVINGTKTFITNGGSADMLLLAAKTDPKAGARGISLFIVDLRGAPGFQVTGVLDKVGQHGADTAELSFTDVHVPTSALLGGSEGAGFGQMMAQLPQERLIVAAQAAGGMDRAVAETISYTKSREAFGHSLFGFQNTAFELAECATIARTCRVFLNYCVEAQLNGTLEAAEAAMAKYWLTDRQCSVVDRCVQLHGGYGYMREYLIARMYEDARVQRIYAGANEVMKEIISRAL
jgi:acyl-CoA dehydrogenase